jgi:hypothetical protein
MVDNEIKLDSTEFIKDWFDSFISNLSVDKLMIETDTATKEKSEFYKSLIYNRPEVHQMARNTSSLYFVERILKDYLKELNLFNAHPQKIAFELSDAKILVWAQIATDDEQTEDALILSEAKANSKYSENGFYISSTIVEECDMLSIPPHYSEASFK